MMDSEASERMRSNGEGRLRKVALTGEGAPVLSRKRERQRCSEKTPM